MDQRDIEQLLKAGEITNTIRSGDIFLLARPNVQRGDQYSLLTIKKEDLLSYITSQVPAPPSLSYKSYVAILNQSGTNAPTATVLYNDLGANVIWTYFGLGTYTATCTGKFTLNKTWVKVQSTIISANVVGSDNGDGNSIYVTTGTVGAFPVPADGLMFDNAIEIRVYN